MKDNVDVRSELGGVIGGAILVAAGTLLSVGLNIAARAVFARSFTPEEYGEFSLGFTLLMIFSLVACLGLQNGLPRQIAFDEAGDRQPGSGGEADPGADSADAPPGEAGTQILWALLLTGVLGVAVGAVLLVSNHWIAVEVFSDESYAQPIALVALGIPFFFTSIRVISATFRGYSRPHERVLFQGLLRNGAFLALLGIVIYLGSEHLTAIATLPLSLGVTALLYFRVPVSR